MTITKAATTEDIDVASCPPVLSTKMSVDSMSPSSACDSSFDSKEHSCVCCAFMSTDRESWCNCKDYKRDITRMKEHHFRNVDDDRKTYYADIVLFKFSFKSVFIVAVITALFAIVAAFGFGFTLDYSHNVGYKTSCGVIFFSHML